MPPRSQQHVIKKPQETTFRKKCNCCGRQLSCEQWHQLEQIGVQEFGNGLDQLEYRNCNCGSTLAIRISMPLLRAAG